MRKNKLLKNFSKISLCVFLVACGKAPLTTFVNLDTTNNQANPFKATEYDEVACKMKTTDLPSYTVATCADGSSPKFSLPDGGFWVSFEDASLWKKYAVSECRKNNERKNNEAALLNELKTLKEALNVYRINQTSCK